MLILPRHGVSFAALPALSAVAICAAGEVNGAAAMRLCARCRLVAEGGTTDPGSVLGGTSHRPRGGIVALAGDWQGFVCEEGVPFDSVSGDLTAETAG